jgi:transposase
MNRLLKPFLKLPNTFNNIRISLDKDKYTGINLYFQDESRFGLMTHVGKYLTARGVKPIVKYKHAFTNTYLYGSYSPVNGDSFVWEINGTDTKIFEAYLQAFSKHNEKEYKVVVIDNAGFHSTKNIDIPDNIFLLNIPPYCPELNPCEKIWQHIKSRFKNKTFNTMKILKEWLAESVSQMTEKQIMSITHNEKYLDNFNAAFSG